MPNRAATNQKIREEGREEDGKFPDREPIEDHQRKKLSNG